MFQLTCVMCTAEHYHITKYLIKTQPQQSGFRTTQNIVGIIPNSKFVLSKTKLDMQPATENDLLLAYHQKVFMILVHRLC